VGIGTSSPDQKLDISEISASAYAIIQTGGAVNAGLFLKQSTRSNLLLTDAAGFLVYDETASANRFRIDTNGNAGINNNDPDQYATSGKVLNLTGTSNNSGPANFFMSGSSANLGRGFASTEVFAIGNITSATEITRATGTGANGFRAYVKIIVTGHTGAIGNGINIKEYYWDGGTGAPVEISTYTNGFVPAISFDNSTSNVWIIKLASSNGSNGFNGVMKVEWMFPIDFASNTWTIS
jgi:hypothetical protein